MDTLAQRFTEHGGRQLRVALAEQDLLAHETTVIELLAAYARVEEFKAGEVVIEQAAADNDILFLLAGAAVIEVHRRAIAERRAGQHVGEMALLDVSATRSATVRATTELVVARVSEEAFTPIANAHPWIWRRMAQSLANRLRERGGLVRARGDRPVLFVGSSVEGLAIARGLQAACSHDQWTTRCWTDGYFGVGKTPIESLMSQLDLLDFGVLVVTADDVSQSRGLSTPAPRDNVILELGLLFGALGRDRTFFLRVRGEELKLPSDLLGVQPLEIPPGDADQLAARVAPAVHEIRSAIQRLGCR